MVALDYFRRLGHDNHRRLSKLYAWKDRTVTALGAKKSKTSWGAEAVDYEKIAGASVQTMKTADLRAELAKVKSKKKNDSQPARKAPTAKPARKQSR